MRHWIGFGQVFVVQVQSWIWRFECLCCAVDANCSSGSLSALETLSREDDVFCLLDWWWQAFAWAFVSNEHTSWEHFAVYWIGPMVGTVVSVWAFNLLFPPKRPVQKGGAVANGQIDKKAEVVKADGSVRRRAKGATQEESVADESSKQKAS